MLEKSDENFCRIHVLMLAVLVIIIIIIMTVDVNSAREYGKVI